MCAFIAISTATIARFGIENHGEFGEGAVPQFGQCLQTRTESGQVLGMTVVKLFDEGIAIDSNHAPAGKDLIFDIELVGMV